MRTLDKRYRRLLLFYPRAYRRQHGEELVTTLLDAAPAGRVRPARGEVLDLVRGGLRQRFRLPVGRRMVVLAALVAIGTGAFGGTAGTWLGLRIAAGLPDRAAQQAIADVVWGQHYDGRLFDPIDGRRPTGVGSRTPPAWSFAAARDRLTAAGWDVRQIEADPMSGPGPALVGGRHGTRIRVEQADGLVWLELWPARPAGTLPLAVVGWLAGAVAGWLLAAWAGYVYRIEATAPRIAVATRAEVLWWSPPVHRVAMALGTAVCAFALFEPVWMLYIGMGLLTDPQTVQGLGPEVYSDAALRLPATWIGLCSGAVVLVTAAAAAVFFRPAADPAPAAAPVTAS